MSDSQTPAAIGAFQQQSQACRTGGSPFSATVLEILAMDFAKQGPVYDLAKDWDERAIEDAMALRLLGGLHRLVLDGTVPDLARHYPSVGGTSLDTLAADVIAVVSKHHEALAAYLVLPPQTNEVGRSHALLGGFLAVAQDTGLPMRLLEIGASAGLNLFWDQFGYSNQEFEWQSGTSDVVLKTDWSGPLPPLPEPPVNIASRAGCDIAPVDVHDNDSCRRLESYVWTDQPERLARLRGAIAIARRQDYRLEKADAGPWLAKELVTPEEGCCTVVFHSIMWEYMPESAQQQVVAELQKAGARASDRAPLAWLRLELVRPSIFPQLKLTTWPGGTERTLGAAHFHGAWVKWGEG